jgi:hypothetical protein
MLQKWFWQGLPFSIVNSTRVGTVISIKMSKLPQSSCARLLCLRLRSWALGCGLWVWFRSVNNEDHLDSKVRLCISACTRGNSLIHYTFYFTRMRYKHSKFGCDESTMKGALLAKRSTFSSVSGLLLEEIPCNSIFVTFRACAKNIPSLVEIGQ